MSKTFGERLRQVRKERGWTQDDLASFLNTTKQVISRYENNLRTPKITVAKDYADKLNIPLSSLIEDELDQEDYYNNPEVAEYAQEIYENPDLRILFDASKKISKRDMEIVVNLVKSMKKDEGAD